MTVHNQICFTFRTGHSLCDEYEYIKYESNTRILYGAQTLKAGRFILT